MPPKLDDKDPPERLNMIITKTMMDRINEWRAANGFVGKSEAARILIERALNAEDREMGRRDGRR